MQFDSMPNMQRSEVGLSSTASASSTILSMGLKSTKHPERRKRTSRHSSRMTLFDLCLMKIEFISEGSTQAQKYSLELTVQNKYE